MGWNGAGVVDRTDGTRTGSQVWQEAADAGVLIRDVDHDTHDQDLADAIEKCLNREGENAAAADIGWGGFKLTSLGNGTARSDAANAGQVQDGGPLWGGTSGGSANAQTIALSPAISAYVAGLTVRFIAGFTITGAATLNVNGVGPKTLASRGGNGLLAGEIVEDEWVTAIYDGTDFLVQKEVVRETVYTESATWNKPGGLVFVDVEVVGGGGGGGGAEGTASQIGAGAGGGAGGYSRKKIPTADLGSSETVTVGAGGTGGDGATPSAGNAGGTSSFGAQCSATGGAGGNTGGSGTSDGRSANPGTGGAGSNGDVNTTGGAGHFGVRFGTSSTGFSGNGGDSVFGGGERGVVEGNSASAAGNYGGGGAGGCSNSATGRDGGDGAGGIVIVREHL